MSFCTKSTKNIKKVKPTKNEDVNYKSTNVFDSVKDEFEAISGIVELSGTWTEVK